jgi:lipoprotein-anchoring transpeptidase ErfK/SrfK
MRCVYRPLVAAIAAGFLSIFSIAPSVAAGEIVAFDGGVGSGTIIIRTSERRLYFVLDEGRAMRYVVGVGRVGRQWSGISYVDGKYVRPNWAPPDAVKRDKPKLPKVIPGGSPANPMGVAALTLWGSEYAIHGTNAPKSIGGFVSYGCIRMYNEDITDLYARVDLGTPVVVVP